MCYTILRRNNLDDSAKQLRHTVKQHLEKFKIVAAIFSGLLVCIQIFSWWTQPKINISATIDIIDYTLPTEIKEQFSYENSLGKIDTLFQLLQQQSAGSLPDSSEKTLRKFILNRFYVDYLNNFSVVYKTLGILKIENTGDREIQDIQVSLRTSIFYEFQQDGTTFTGISNGKIKVGALRPTEEITIRLWTTYLFENDVKITYPDGAVKPDKMNKVSGFFAILAWLFPNSWIMFILLFFVISYLGFSIYIRGYSQGQANFDETKKQIKN